MTEEKPSIFYSPSAEGKYIYHYTKAKTCIEYILKQKTLKLSKLKDLNDPREAKEKIFLLQNITDWEAAKIVEQKLSQHFFESLRILCFCTDIPHYSHEDPYGEIYSKGHNFQRMWEQYAKQYSGVCLIFNKDLLSKYFREWALNKNLFPVSGLVKYKNKKVPSLHALDAYKVYAHDNIEKNLGKFADKHFEEHYRELLFQKNREWRTECEYRFAIKADGLNDEYFPYKDSLIGIVLGDKFKEKHKKAIAKYCKNIQVAQMEWRDGFPTIQPSHWRLLSNL